ncbi:MAG: hypothetical protein VR67_01665 [Peptococcaceae bacterium BRH_c8a]|nr:MAG: hypothetical protein VR67_01665 [Peptococcaceae bacterium BRH_c8a]
MRTLKSINGIKNSKGVTLVELIIALAILNIVLAAAYNFFSFGNNSFIIGSNQSNVQRDIRTVSFFITKEVRNATEFVLLDTPDTPFESEYEYIWIDGATIKHIESGLETNKAICSILGDDSYFTLEQLSNGKNIINFIIKGQEGNQTNELNSGILLNNLNNLSEITDPKKVIRYKGPSS